MNTISQPTVQLAPLDIARARILHANGLDDSDLSRTLSHVAAHAVDDADLYLEWRSSESFALDEGAVKSGSFAIDQGVGVRSMIGERTGLSHAAVLRADTLLSAASASRAIAKSSSATVVHAASTRGWAVQPSVRESLYALDSPLGSIDQAAKIALLERVDTWARGSDPRIFKVNANLSAGYKVVLIARLDGRLVADARPMITLVVTVLARMGERVEEGFRSVSLRGDYRDLTDARVSTCVQRAVHQALVNLEAVAMPGGVMDVVMGPGGTGVLLHEAVGHGLEADFVRKGESLYAGRVGERVAAADITIVDDGTLPGSRGSLNVDDEGNATRCTTLIENGVLTGFMQDSLNARLMGSSFTGNARRESYAALTLPRMTNTYMRAGTRDPQGIIASVKNGLYVAETGGGQVDIANGNFVFSTALAWRIENGKLTTPVKGATLVGNGPQALRNMNLVGNDLRMGDGGGSCGKAGQSVPVGLGQPTLRIDGMTVGGAL